MDDGMWQRSKAIYEDEKTDFFLQTIPSFVALSSELTTVYRRD